MSGVTTALVLFIFVCVIFPERVKNKAQFYAALIIIFLIILLDALGWAVNAKDETAPFRVFVYVACAALQVTDILLLFLAAGGITWKELAGEMADAYEVIRRGETTKEVIIPLSGDFSRRRTNPQPESNERIEIVDPSPTPPADFTPSNPSDEHKSEGA